MNEDADSETLSDNGKQLNTYDEFLPTVDVLLPETILVNKPVDIFVYYNIPSNCHTFKDVFYSANNNERTIAIVSTAIKSDTCNTKKVRKEKTSFKFNAKNKGDYTLKFWKGLDSTGVDDYLIYNIKIKY